ncbi:NAD(P)/FAD-dependent oxidoreductase [Roseomonas sp. HJA6]|uniref:NAD(P)/FAD-dependent oxidoreductase n=1 Tax=Roseomonas alba TaxID=2846776 RepID=A0ABS7AJF8_9PROT|nr:NAD(P)/FAD-dependent oxidoreductase [Neoroseomonas alba]MBW6401480.1 NAD(P)/FAD-dependent oxidoreductase [Neoroseomonas alba]
MPKQATRVDAVIVGAGFAGLYMLHRLRGLGLSAIVLEAGEDVGGTWYWNRYPGARCDVESMQYSYSFDEALQQDWRWSERYATQPEILRYANHVADRFDLRRDIRFDARVSAARYDEAASLWHLMLQDGSSVTARFCIMATGCLSSAKRPEIPGLDDFRGPAYHTGHWPHDPVDFTGLRVGVIGTGSSAIQSIPVIAAQAAQVTVFQRTPNFSVPAHNRPIDEAYERSWKDDYAARRRHARTLRTGIDYPLNPLSALEVSAEDRERQYETSWAAGGTAFMAAFSDLLRDEDANATARDFVHRQIRRIVQDPKTADLLCPTNHPIGTKRICVDTDYYATFNRPNVRLVDLRATPIDRITEHGLRTTTEDFSFDALVLATGFDAMTGALLAIDIAGRGGVTLRDAWADGPVSYLGLMVAGFPNLFTITGPGSPSVLSNMMVSIEQHVDWIADALAAMRARGATSIEAAPDAQDDWVRQVAEVGASTLYPRANSWYMGVNVPGKPQVFMPYVGGVGTYREICDDIAARGYAGFRLTAAPEAAAAE